MPRPIAMTARKISGWVHSRSGTREHSASSRLKKLGEYGKGGWVSVVCRCLGGCFLDVAEFHAVLCYVSGSFDDLCGLFVELGSGQF
jgi:hypothetical protein